MKAQDLIIPGAIVVGGYYLLTSQKNELPVKKSYTPARKQATTINKNLSGLGRVTSCCRWINMGGYWAWVCGPGLCHGGDAPYYGGGLQGLGYINGVGRVLAIARGPVKPFWIPNLGAAVPATPKVPGETTTTQTYNNGTSMDLAPPTGFNFDSIMQFIEANALWLGIGAAGLLALVLFKK